MSELEEELVLLLLFIFNPCIIEKFLVKWDRDTLSSLFFFFVSINHRISLDKKPLIFFKNIVGFKMKQKSL